MQQILNSWDIDVLDSWKEVDTINSSEIKNDLSSMIGLDEIMKGNDGITVKGLYDNFDMDSFEEEQTNTYSFYQNNKAPIKKAILLRGDSFRESMIPSLCTVFQNVYVIYNTTFTHEDTIPLIDEINPDYVIYEFVERYSGNYTK